MASIASANNYVSHQAIRGWKDVKYESKKDLTIQVVKITNIITDFKKGQSERRFTAGKYAALAGLGVVILIAAGIAAPSCTGRINISTFFGLGLGCFVWGSIGFRVALFTIEQHDDDNIETSFYSSNLIEFKGTYSFNEMIANISQSEFSRRWQSLSEDKQLDFQKTCSESEIAFLKGNYIPLAQY